FTTKRHGRSRGRAQPARLQPRRVAAILARGAGMPRACVLATLGDDPHTQGLFRVARIAHKAGIAAHVLPPGSPLDAILKQVHLTDPEWVGFSYRLSPEVAVQEFRRALGRLHAQRLLERPNGAVRRVALAGLPETIRVVEELRHEFPCDIWPMPQDTDLMRAC